MLKIGGKYIINEICRQIEHSDFFCADVTTINPNVMFELGFAIARNKRVWLIRDDTFEDSKKEFDQLKVLTTIGYSPYLNSEQVIKAFFSEAPHESLHASIFRQSIEPLLSPGSSNSILLYLKSRLDTEASVRVTRIVEQADADVVIDDPQETSVHPLIWYAEKLYGACGFIAHFLSPSRQGSRLHNARYALIAGLAMGFDIQTLLLSEQADLLTPIDYRDAVRYYSTATEASREVTTWLQTHIRREVGAVGGALRYADALRLATELRGFHLQLGEYVAENESRHLSTYFVETTAYLDVINGTHTIFVGRKGTGKTANLLRAADNIASDTQSVVVLIKPAGYEIEGLVNVFSSLKTQDAKGYVIESLWKFMLYSEIGHAAVRQIQENALWQLADDPAAQSLLDLVGSRDSPFAGDFSVRLERTVASLRLVQPTASNEKFRVGISEALHSGALGELRNVLSQVLLRKRRVIVLVDNLDKPWIRGADLGQLSEFLLGLLGAANRINEELRHAVKKSYFTTSAAIFMRSDIFDHVRAVAREPDKLSYTRLRWDDPEMLLRVIEERYMASHGSEVEPSQMWQRYFCPDIDGVPMRSYLTSRILPRPRDIVFFVKAAVANAVNRRHDRVEAKDVLDAERQYSQYALDSILVENGITTPQLEGVLLEFLGLRSIVAHSEVTSCILKAGIASEQAQDVVQYLVKLSFLGLETSRGQFAYTDEARELNKNWILARRLTSLMQMAEARYEINPAFRAYLEISSDVADSNSSTAVRH
ncbi:MAG: hypothetical protein JNK87_35175 [Bryobacterales bacterium]|nr:hypothetical protein [Bryobacterales bacterium]